MTLPANWEIASLESCLSALIDYRGKTPRKTSSGIPLVTAKIVKNGRIEEPNEFIADEDYEAWMTRGYPDPGDVVITTEAPLGEVAQLGTETVALAQRIILLRGKPKRLDNSFLKYSLMSEPLQSQLRSRSSGTTVIGIKQSELRKVEIPLPPFEEQTKIARTLSALDDKIDLNRRMNATLEQLAQALFKSWFIDFEPVKVKAAGRQPLSMDSKMASLFSTEFDESDLGPKPKEWTVSTIGDLVKVVGGATPDTKQTKYWEHGVHNWATPKDLSALASPVLLSTERTISNDGLKRISSGLLPAGSVLMSSRAPIGYLAISEIPVAINQGFIGMLPEDGISNLFILFWAKANQRLIVGRANGSTFLEISKSNFRPIQLIRPTLGVMKAFDELVRPLYERISNNERETQRLIDIRDLLLPKLISGEIQIST